MWIMVVSKTSDHIQIIIKMPNPSQQPPKLQIRTQRTWRFFAPSKSRLGAEILSISVSKTNDHIHIKVKVQNPSQEPPASSEAPIEDLKDIDVLCTLKIKIENQDSDYGYMKTSYHIQINIKIPNPSQEPPVSSKAPNVDLKEIDVLCTFKIKMESQN